MLKLPPISAMDDYLTSKSWTSEHTPANLPTPNDQWKSPPYTNRNELHRDSSYKPLFSTPNLSPTFLYQQQKPLEQPSRNSYFQRRNSEASSSSYHSISIPAKYRMEQDIEEVIRQCNTLCDSMTRNQQQFINAHLHEHQSDIDSTRPWLDDMIGRANEVLNALLRLRKHQIATEQQQQQSQLELTCEYQQAKSHTYPHYQPQQHPSNSSERTSNVSIQHYSRQRKRGRRPAFQGRCHSCNISETPEWRRGPDGARTLCNACGLHYAKLARKQQESQSTNTTLSSNKRSKLTSSADNKESTLP
ncbi:GATA zinc finger domain-containing protein 10 [Choanephora cucurbitarum]|uniref:GATA zinc finger domain-containing protein 10 n=1 Tax=Choanephora cucurbitarum TaxID=101091 RepID=A0A1C7NMY1_9FUNG|nr:GATA zinc finger domain-containing protein 10 [Choanephora cucurbitarum]